MTNKEKIFWSKRQKQVKKTNTIELLTTFALTGGDPGSSPG
jgi:hypothetical protein